MIPPTSIDGTDITGATIDGTDVQEITVDGDVVFSAQTLPVAYSNLVAWYPFDSAEYGGSNADDVTAIIGGSGDDTAYDGTVSGATYLSNGGGTDINAGANSGAFDFDGNNDQISTNLNFPNSATTITAWINQDTQDTDEYQPIFHAAEFTSGLFITRSGFDGGLVMSHQTGSNSFQTFNQYQEKANQWVHVAGTWDGTNTGLKVYEDGQEVPSSISSEGTFSETTMHIGRDPVLTTRVFDGQIDDVRLYNRVLSQSEISQIVSNTPHP